MKEIIDWHAYLNLQEDPNRYDISVGYAFYDQPIIEAVLYDLGEWVRFEDYKILQEKYKELVFKVLEKTE